jgi:hypothetical protein
LDINGSSSISFRQKRRKIPLTTEPGGPNGPLFWEWESDYALEDLSALSRSSQGLHKLPRDQFNLNKEGDTLVPPIQGILEQR